MRYILALVALCIAFDAEARTKTVVNAITGQTSVVPLPPTEEAEADARDANPVIPQSPAVEAEREIQNTLSLRAIVRVLAKKFNLTERQLLDAIKAELP